MKELTDFSNQMETGSNQNAHMTSRIWYERLSMLYMGRVATGYCQKNKI